MTSTSQPATPLAAQPEPLPMRTLAIDASYAPEVVEFWAKKYQDVKAENERLQRHYASQPDRDALQREHGRLKDLIEQLQEESRRRGGEETRARQEAKAELDALKARVAKLEREKEALGTRLRGVEEEKEALSARVVGAEKTVNAATQQVLKFYAQSTVLALEEDQSRHAKVGKLFDPVDFFNEEMEYQTVKMPQNQMKAVSERLCAILKSQNFESKATTVYFLPRPPKSMPLRIRTCAQHGYWFCPIFTIRPGECFELVVEGDPDQWLYLGSYESSLMEGAEMRLSEWLMLDENTKLAHCLRAASQELPDGQYASYPAQLEVKRRYEMGEWSVPCYALRGVGFSRAFYTALSAECAKGVQAQPLAMQVVLPVRRTTTSSAAVSPTAKRARLHGPGQAGGSGS
ncbi:hypothetical protein DENSPDRAFT_933454 [Dentipellis sp. KUC8613]|nr:hypothetical protein DENSPDRAFT_933454 [Dentipellis sp. KUC8613]